MRFLTLSIIMLLGIINSGLEAKMYKWVDDSGKVHYSDRKPIQKRVKTKSIKNIYSSASLPAVDIKKAIPYRKSKPSQRIFFNALEIKLPGANYNDVKIGKIYTGRGCSRKVGDLVWIKGNGIFDNVRLNRIFLKEFNRSGYRLVDNNSAINYQSSNRLHLKAELVKIKINTCSASANHSFTNSNDVYLKIDWKLEDTLLGKTLYEKSSEGIYEGMSKPARKRGSEQSVDRAINIAINNALADSGFAKILSKEESITTKQNQTDAISIGIKYSSSEQSFKSKIKELKKSAITIRVAEGHGSGVLISKDGYILTNAHVVSGAREVLVILDDEELEATVIRTEPLRDVALLKLKQKSNLTISKLSSDKPEVGDTIFVIGTPISEELNHTVTSGIISAMRVKNGFPFYQTDASINHGNSGGPVFNDSGELIAISVSGLQTKSGAGLGLNYLIPIEDALDAINIKRIKTKVKKKQEHTTKALKYKPRKNKKTVKKIGARKLNSQVLNLYQKALQAKNRKQLDTAKGMLKRANASIPKKNQSKEAKLIRDELHYHLPIAYARKALKEKNEKMVIKYLAPLQAYIKNHPNRFSFAQEISSIRESLKYLKEAMLATDKVNGQMKLGYIRIFMRRYYAEEGVLPASKDDLSTILNKEFGYRLTNNYDVVDYKRSENSFSIMFVDIKTNQNIVIEDSF